MSATLVTAALPLALVVYGLLLLLLAPHSPRVVIAAVTAAVIAVLLWVRWRRARFSAYVFFSVLAARSVLVHSWGTLTFAALAIALMQTEAARRAWPRVPRRRHHAVTALK